MIERKPNYAPTHLRTTTRRRVPAKPNCNSRGKTLLKRLADHEVLQHIVCICATLLALFSTFSAFLIVGLRGEGSFEAYMCVLAATVATTVGYLLLPDEENKGR